MREDKTSEVAITVRMPRGTLDRVDALVKARLTRIPRHSWLLEAIYEKLYKEERVEGVLDIFWENSGDVGATTRYCLHFIRFDQGHGAVAPMTIVGDASLEHYLIGWGFKLENARGWIQKLKIDKSVSVPNVMMPAEAVGPHGFRVGNAEPRTMNRAR